MSEPINPEQLERLSDYFRRLEETPRDELEAQLRRIVRQLGPHYMSKGKWDAAGAVAYALGVLDALAAHAGIKTDE